MTCEWSCLESWGPPLRLFRRPASDHRSSRQRSRWLRRGSWRCDGGCWKRGLTISWRLWHWAWSPCPCCLSCWHGRRTSGELSGGWISFALVASRTRSSPWARRRQKIPDRSPCIAAGKNWRAFAGTWLSTSSRSWTLTGRSSGTAGSHCSAIHSPSHKYTSPLSQRSVTGGLSEPPTNRWTRRHEWICTNIRISMLAFSMTAYRVSSAWIGLSSEFGLRMYFAAWCCWLTYKAGSFLGTKCWYQSKGQRSSKAPFCQAWSKRPTGTPSRVCASECPMENWSYSPQTQSLGCTSSQWCWTWRSWSLLGGWILSYI